MDSKLCTAILVMILQTLVFKGINGEPCISYCGDETMVSCPSGYSCQEWGCTYECHRTGQYQPELCPMVKCVAISCPLGFKRNADGCEGCTCANVDLIRAIEEQHYIGPNGAASVTAIGSLLVMPIIYASLQAAGM